MIKYFGITLLFIFTSWAAFSQSIPGDKANGETTFEKIALEIKGYKLDTSSAPNDKITRKIIELRNLRGGFNINEAINYKLEEDKQKNDITKEQFDEFSYFFKSGNGKRWLDNSVIWIYRHHFTYKELKQLVNFYKTSGGQKMATDFPVIMIKTLSAAESIKSMYQKQHKK